MVCTISRPPHSPIGFPEMKPLNYLTFSLVLFMNNLCLQLSNYDIISTLHVLKVTHHVILQYFDLNA